ncbi:hypothetical protein ECC07_06400 [Helicobacter pylori]|nr:hypothetical protein ECC07_06400 [Helicobacter pylori]
MNGINRRWHGYPLKQLFYFTWWELSKKSSLRRVIKSKNAKGVFKNEKPHFLKIKVVVIRA